MCHGLLLGIRSDQRVSCCQHCRYVTFNRSASAGKTDSVKNVDDCSVATPEASSLHKVPPFMTQRPRFRVIGLLFGFALPTFDPNNDSSGPVVGGGSRQESSGD